MPIALALVAGALASLNPCGFPLLPAFLSFYVGAEEGGLPRAPSRMAQGLVVGFLVTAGFLGVFAVVGLPIAYGAAEITRAVPWVGLALGAVLFGTGIGVLSGRYVGVSIRRPPGLQKVRGARGMLLFGGAYAVCSLGCTLPVFLALVGASLATESSAEGAVVFGAYGLGMAVVLMALSVGAALARDGLARRVKGLIPYMRQVSGSLLALAGGYLAYYWARVLWSPPEALSQDPLVTLVQRFANLVQRSSASGGGRALVLVAAAVVAGAIAVALWQWTGGKSHRRTADDSSPDRPEPADRPGESATVG